MFELSYYTHNANNLTGQAVSNVGGRLFAVVGIGTKDVKAKINFGQQLFMYKAYSMMQAGMRRVSAEFARHA